MQLSGQNRQLAFTASANSLRGEEYIFFDDGLASLPAPDAMAKYSESGDMSLARLTYRVRVINPPADARPFSH